MTLPTHYLHSQSQINLTCASLPGLAAERHHRKVPGSVICPTSNTTIPRSAGPSKLSHNPFIPCENLAEFYHSEFETFPFILKFLKEFPTAAPPPAPSISRCSQFLYLEDGNHSCPISNSLISISRFIWVFLPCSLHSLSPFFKAGTTACTPHPPVISVASNPSPPAAFSHTTDTYGLVLRIPCVFLFHG